MMSLVAQEQASILVVEDNIDCLIYMIHALTMFNYSFVTAQYAEPAFYLAKKHLPKLILLDIALPGQDGFELIKKLKSHKLTRNIPIIAVSALSKIEAQPLVFAAGCNEYIEKPYLLEELKGKINQYLSLQLAS